MFRSGNPIFGEQALSEVRGGVSEHAMTAKGTVSKSLILLFLVVFAAAFIWANQEMVRLLIPAAIVGFVLALVTTFKKEWAGITAPLYAALEGIVLGGISLIFERMYPGIVVQAVMFTFGTLFAMLVAYRTGLVKPTQRFRLGLSAALGGLMIVYLVAIGAQFFGYKIPFIYGYGPGAIIFSIVVVCIAALCLILDFDFIEQGAAAGLPHYMEWYGAFGLMVTLIWMYLEILRLLALTRRND